MLKPVDNDPKTLFPGNLLWIASKRRVAATRIFAGVLIALLLLTESRWAQHPVLSSLFEIFGLVLVTVGAFGRLWASMYISGYKVQRLIREGPYSIVRNPLYFFSLFGSIGVALATKSLLITALVLAGFIFYYPLVVVREEKKLADLHGEEYAQYARQTPRFVPNFALYHQPETYQVKVNKYQQAFLDAVFFIWIYGLVQLVETLHTNGLLPVLFQIS